MRRATCMTTACPSEAVRDRLGLDGRLHPGSSPAYVSLGPPSGDGRSKDYTRQALSQDFCRSALLEGRNPLSGIVPAGQGKAPGPDHCRQPGETPGNAGTGALMPISDPAPVSGGGKSKLPSPGAVERRRKTENPHTTPSTLPPSQKVWEKRRTADAAGLGAAIIAFLRNSHEPSIAYSAPCFLSLLGPASNLGLAQLRLFSHPSLSPSAGLEARTTAPPRA